MLRLIRPLIIALTAASAHAEPSLVEKFLQRPQFWDVELSDGGTHLAAIVPLHGHSNLLVVDFASKAAIPITDLKDEDVVFFDWIGNSRLLFAIGNAFQAPGGRRYNRLYAANADGTEVRDLSRLAKLSRGFRYLRRHSQKDKILVEAHERSASSVDVYVLDTRSGAKELLTFDSPGGAVRYWIFDKADVPRIAVTQVEAMTAIWHRAAAGAPWVKLDEYLQGTGGRFAPLAFDYDNQTLYVAAPSSTSDRQAIWTFDLEKRQLKEMIARHPEVDLNRLVFSRAKRKLLGIGVDAERPAMLWFDEDMALLQRTVDRLLPDRMNVLQGAESNAQRVLVASYSDVVPLEFHLLDRAALTLAPIAKTYPWLKDERLVERKFIRYAARDGLQIPGYLTLPTNSGARKVPLVVEIHGGPWIPKHSWGFDPFAQFLAARGYAVLQPDFRGTFGYGSGHVEASTGQWGLAMQDDITDGVEWLAREGIIDRERVCLFGMSYGGYAALWGLIKTPELYRCGIAGLAVTDLALLFDLPADDPMRANWLKYGGRILIGDPEKDRDRFRSVSPLYNAAKLRAPVLLAFGSLDRRVPLEHGRQMKQALDRYGKTYEWVVYSDEGHGFSLEANRLDFYRRVDAFLKKHLD